MSNTLKYLYNEVIYITKDFGDANPLEYRRLTGYRLMLLQCIYPIGTIASQASVTGYSKTSYDILARLPI